MPYPPTYGGVIDVFYKIQALAENNVDIYLHVFSYGRKNQAILNKYCKEVNYYKRNTSPFMAMGILPYLVKSRKSKELINNVKRIEAPILFEGLHTTHILKRKLFADRKIFVRTHNIEHQYYLQLSKNETNIFKKFYFRIEASR